MCVDGKSVKVIAAYQKPHEVWDTASLALQLIKSSALRWLLALCAGEHRDLRAVTTLTVASPPAFPWHSESSQKSHIPPENWKCQPRRISAFHYEIPVMAGKQTSWSAGSFPDLCPCRTWNSSSSNQLSITNAYIHTKTTYLQKHIPTNNSECWKINQRTRNMSNRNSYSCITPEKVLRYGQQKRHLNTYKQAAKGDVHGVWPAETTGGGYKGMREALPAEAGAMLSHFSGRCHLRELLLELLSQMWKLSPTNTQTTQVVNCFPKTHSVYQLRMIFLFLLLIRPLSCFPSLLLSLLQHWIIPISNSVFKITYKNTVH